MTITSTTADQLEALALSIFDPHIIVNPNPVLGNTYGIATGLRLPDPATDSQYYALIAPAMLAIEGRVMAPGFLYTLNVTNALQGRPKHWWMNLGELDNSYGWPAICSMDPHEQPGYVEVGGAASFGGTIGLATCACILHAWATIVRRWLAGNYPLAIAPPPA